MYLVEVHLFRRCRLELHGQETPVVPVFNKRLQRLVARRHIVGVASPLELLSVRQTGSPSRRCQESLEIVVRLAHISVEAFVHKTAMARRNLRHLETAYLHFVCQRRREVRVGLVPVLRAVQRRNQHLRARRLASLFRLSPDVQHPSQRRRERLPCLDHLHEETQLFDVRVVQPVNVHYLKRHLLVFLRVRLLFEHSLEFPFTYRRREVFMPQVAAHRRRRLFQLALVRD